MKKLKTYGKKLQGFGEQYPLFSLITVFALIAGSILLFHSQKETEKSSQEITQKVALYNPEDTAYTVATGKVQREDTVALVATSSGVVTYAIAPGQKVSAGQTIVQLADTYTGTSTAQSALELAKRNETYGRETYAASKNILDIQKDALSQADNDTATIERKQAAINKKALDLSLDIASLTRLQAADQAELLRTAAPFAGIIQDVRVVRGNRVNLGDTVAVVKSSASKKSQVVVYLNKERAAHLATNKEAYLTQNGERIPLQMIYLATTAVANQGYALTLALPETVLVADGESIEVSLPLEGDTVKIIPLEAVHYGQNGAEVFVSRDGKAIAQEVTLGDVLGNFVEVLSGIENPEVLILTRNISDGQLVTAETKE